jgi:hypothetical protein
MGSSAAALSGRRLMMIHGGAQFINRPRTPGATSVENHTLWPRRCVRRDGVKSVLRTDGARGYDPTTSDKSRQRWSSAAIALGRRLGGRCIECGLKLTDRRMRHGSRRDYCSAHELPYGGYRRVKREKEIDALAKKLAAALSTNLVGPDIGIQNRYTERVRRGSVPKPSPKKPC